MSIAHPTGVVRLDREGREAIRREIWIIASGVEDLRVGLGDPKYGRIIDREFTVGWIEKLRGIVALFDAIGWEEPGEDQVIVDADVAIFASDRADELEHSFKDLYATDLDRAALLALRSIADVAGATVGV